MGAPIVAILEPGYADYATERALLNPLGVRLEVVPEGVDAVSTLAERKVVALMVRERPVTQEELDAFPDLKIIVRYGVGVDNLDLDITARRQIIVSNVPDYGAEIEVSEHAVALYLAVQRRLVTRDRDVRSGAWDIGQTEVIPSRKNATLGLVGYGRIGVEAHKKFCALGFERTLVSDPSLSQEDAAERQVERVDIGTLCKESDLISLHAPLLPSTWRIIDADRIALMKPTTVVVNVSRGGLIDEAALADALKSGKLFGAGLDVLEREPLDPNSPLLSAPNTIITDHMGWYSERSVEAIQSSAAHEVARVLKGEAPHNCVNKSTN